MFMCTAIRCQLTERVQPWHFSVPVSGRKERVINRANDSFESLLAEVQACNICADALPLGPRPVFQLSPTAKVLIASQAPGIKVHDTGIPFMDRSGERLREWIGWTTDEFYDARKVAILPMGLCYPGRTSNSGDAPPRPECALIWRDRLLAQMPDLKLTLLVGIYAQNHVLGRGTLTERVMNFQTFLPDYFPLPHPSWRSRVWAAKNPWFETKVLPALRSAVTRAFR